MLSILEVGPHKVQTSSSFKALSANMGALGANSVTQEESGAGESGCLINGAVLTFSVIILTVIIIVYMPDIVIGLGFHPSLGVLRRLLHGRISTQFLQSSFNTR